MLHRIICIYPCHSGLIWDEIDAEIKAVRDAKRD